MAENKEIIEKLVELIEIYLENAQMNEVSTEWQEGDIDFEEVLDIVVTDGLYDLNFTEEQTNEFLALYKALNQKQVEISEAKLDKKDKKGDNIMEEVKKEDEKLLAHVKAVANLVDFLFHDYGAPWEQIHELLKSAGLSEEEISEYNLSDLEEDKEPVMESKKPVKEGIRLIYNPREKTEVKEEAKLSFDGEPLPVDVKETNTHTKLRLFKVK
jgi:hypothetical protein